MNEPTRMQEFVGELLRLLAREGYDVETFTRFEAVRVHAIRRSVARDRDAHVLMMFGVSKVETSDLAPMSHAIMAADHIRHEMSKLPG